MKKYLTLGLAAVLTLATVFAAPRPASAQSAGLVSSIINRMERNRRDLRSLRASISMEKYDAQIRDTDKRVGTLLYVPGTGKSQAVRVDWRSPQETLAVADGQYTLLRQRMKLAYKGDANSNRNKVSGVLGFGLNVSQAQLKSSFDMQYIGEEALWGGVQTSHVKLVPKGKAGYSYAEVWVDGSGMPVQTKVVERNGDATTVRLMDIQRNAAINKGEFKLELGSDIKIVRG
ncbi:MAG TPA: outer-membrane lipoprotein carrier protein LolA [Pyrinomonadaceae bacterium]|jgi:outer membrane lipoprotein-sorting protein